jgi:hypothetical protein
MLPEDTWLSPLDVKRRWPQFGLRFQNNHRKKGDFAPFIQIGDPPHSRIWYRESTFLKWLDEQMRTTPKPVTRSGADDNHG